ncbi:hypothetical protein N7495_005423 [Penicillium taxi]|uniref:uncharacterized protein n=1 Tax=Penicillium taxi TaxID=168475 RepID=UPI00254513B2|nr:uncharacterized protein N7495_005423 [Penicillium taxi]KAJ5893732.1 hypothetical protein N7495_005423 [Penicillium taxi]
MSFLPSIRTGSCRLAQSSYVIRSASTFHTTSAQRSLKAGESDKSKDAQLKKAKEGKAQWNDTLASDSEAEIKADRGEHGTTDKAFQQTEKKIKKQK